MLRHLLEEDVLHLESNLDRSCVGHARAGWPGLLVAGVAFIVPATLLVGLAAWVYVTYGALPTVSGVLYGIKPVVIAVVAQALWDLGRSAVKSTWLAVLGVLSAVAVAAAYANWACWPVRRP